ncbi:hypothetical protein CBS63078_7059 [Aspergillus niger]|uniref:D-xylose reductase [NAD(P)H] n=3 Tax=Aspergillus niger TaxID=5061 RepID=A2QBJ9_ASPNC|nr:uncharacterized protein An02g00310 [Aspergillus niger]RDH24964.1 Aldo/keto reductase [Aspergillus niger ATCC 13496]KAI2815189.1 hypothetical protein CBS115989_7876 [Aspergillus niger]KAI2827338.1 hypothetical protein CBS133816_6610 [Aspergillus niger]KAI2859453.1 hypothetical protein CBS11232_1914 [Aspergillus niger]KAI2866069.1 hypothetical protein CBS12448_1592 [Aspergillus niger]|eukprot:XP_001399169.1 aldo/keto reductase [Aspergillus niger CBS 513.88]
MSTKPSTNIKVVFGAMTVGQAGLSGCRQTNQAEIKAVLDVFQKHGHTEVDTSRAYAKGTSEELLGQSQWQNRGLQLATKIYPTANTSMPGDKYTLRAADLRQALSQSLEALQTESVDIWYLHAPDRTTPLEETLRAVDELYREGKFKRLGLSNFMSWEVARACDLCEQNNWVRPSVYQGIYNPLHRAIENELVPCLRFYKIALYAFQPLAGGLLTGRYHFETNDFEQGSRYSPDNGSSSTMNARYWNKPCFAAVSIIEDAAKRHSLTVSECTYRWLAHHSALKNDDRDALIIGSSRPDQLESNLVDLEKGPLPDDVVEAIDHAWQVIQDPVRKYWH